MSTTTPTLRKLGAVCIPTRDHDAMLEFYAERLGLEVITDLRFGPNDSARWIEVRVPGTETAIALAAAPPDAQVGGMQTGILFETPDIEATHAALKAAGVDVDDEIMHMGDPVPPMFWLRDPEGNVLMINNSER